jgi:hypothetical protein
MLMRQENKTEERVFTMDEAIVKRMVGLFEDVEKCFGKLYEEGDVECSKCIDIEHCKLFTEAGDIPDAYKSTKKKVAPTSFGTMIKSAVFSDDRLYRYTLERVWLKERPLIMFICLNPSGDTTRKHHPTRRRCMRYACSCGYGGLIMANLFAYQTPDPRVLREIPDPVGPENDEWLKKSADRATMIIAAWGAKGTCMDRGDRVRTLLEKSEKPLYHLGLTMHKNQPHHPLFLRKDAKPILWQPKVLA